jgi:PAS domain S-box-containing protein
MNNLEEIAGISNSLIYIVEDNSQNVILLENLLSLLGYNNVWSTTDPEASLKKLSEKQPDLLLLDLMMPKISGFDILNEIKNQGEKVKYFPVIVVSADIEQNSKDKALSLGASDFVTKPFNFKEINLRIKNLLINKSLLNRLQETNDHLEEMVKERTVELLKAKEEAERNERKFRLLFESNLDEINLFHIDETGPSNFIESNTASEHILGYTKEELKSLSVKDIDIQMNPDYFKTKFDLLKENGSISFETVVKRKDGSHRTVEVRATLIELEGKLTVMNIYHDVTEKSKYLETLLQQNKALKEIAWTQSHIVRAPLARMMGAIYLLEDTDFSKFDSDANDFLKIILSSAKEFDQIIREISEKSNQN